MSDSSELVVVHLHFLEEELAVELLHWPCDGGDAFARFHELNLAHLCSESRDVEVAGGLDLHHRVRAAAAYKRRTIRQAIEQCW